MTLLTPAGAAGAYYALFGWAPAGGLPADAVPGPNTLWTLESGEALTDTTPVTLRWDNGQGLVFRRTMAVDANYMFTLTQRSRTPPVRKCGSQPYGIIARHGKPSGPEEFLHPARGRDPHGGRPARRD